MDKKIIKAGNAPEAIGPYSQAVLAGDFIFISGQLPLHPLNGSVGSNIKEQTAQSIENIIAILKETNATIDSVVKTTVYLKNMNDFNEMNSVYSKYFTDKFPARVCIEVSRSPKDVDVEIEAIAVL